MHNVEGVFNLIDLIFLPFNLFTGLGLCLLLLLHLEVDRFRVSLNFLDAFNDLVFEDLLSLLVVSQAF